MMLNKVDLEAFSPEASRENRRAVGAAAAPELSAVSLARWEDDGGAIFADLGSRSGRRADVRSWRGRGSGVARAVEFDGAGDGVREPVDASGGRARRATGAGRYPCAGAAAA